MNIRARLMMVVFAWLPASLALALLVRSIPVHETPTAREHVQEVRALIEALDRAAGASRGETAR